MSGEHEAGRATDALVAALVMGLPVICSRVLGVEHEDHYRIFARHKEGRTMVRVLPPYSTDIGAAMDVLEWLNRTIGGVGLWMHQQFPGQMLVQVETEMWEGSGREAEEYASDVMLLADYAPAPLAICRAALATVEAAPPARAGEGGAR